ncbi:MAG: hypothetical protein ACREIC_22985, partial [Limisphaerales bacterium]
PRASGWFDLDSLPILQEARRNRLTAAQTGFEMGVPFNELNRVLDLGFRALPWGVRGYLSAKLQEVGTQDAVKNSRGRADLRPGEARTDDTQVANPREEQRIAEFSSSPAVAPPSPSNNPIMRAAELLSGIKPLPPSDPQLLSKLRRFLFDQRRRALARLGAGDWNAEVPLLDISEETTQLEAQLRPFIEAELASGFPELSAEAVAAQLNGWRLSLERINRLTLEQLQGTIAQGLGAQEAKEELAQRLKAVFNAASSHCAETVARAQTTLRSPPQFNVARESAAGAEDNRREVESAEILNSYLSPRPSRLRGFMQRPA